MGAAIQPIDLTFSAAAPYYDTPLLEPLADKVPSHATSPKPFLDEPIPTINPGAFIKDRINKDRLQLKVRITYEQTIFGPESHPSLLPGASTLNRLRTNPQ